ncbi:PD-(D/E)XK nuclease family protein [Staphylococcus felis]|uniref:PD-(D/E)XK nuclease family protein n=1 Tax=Staphylococcus felis TaxID=46127 RepID=A0ABS0QLL0_9STAP|nr:PD-(D/E)XK nuclease family protein [Staphylococcus felis]MBH9580093.1 PD-(D/E)XK nuclease family protein [Staphylococcus felis]REI09505.1 hypothetical protein DOS69_01840 [Staphylococcus felis]REI33619.1 hypothetical protein DOS82_05845 [Staphylococcus felis]
MSLAQAFLEQLNKFHTFPEPYDDELNIHISEGLAKYLRQGKKVDWSKPFFAPSSASKCPRELYTKALRNKQGYPLFRKDSREWRPHQRRVTAQGTKIGDWLQYEILLMERHYEAFTGEKPRFIFDKTEDKMPRMEDFAYVSHEVEFDGQKFNLNGTTDGILIDTHTGERVILEIKSKQETPAKTNYTQMKEPKIDHINQVTCYSEMYGVDKAIIVYVNTAKPKWFADEETLAKTPDIRAFDVDITGEMKINVFSYFADITKAVLDECPPLPHLAKWQFNDYKSAIAKTLTDDEINQLEIHLSLFKPSTNMAWMKRSMESALVDIKRRKGII